MITSRPVFHGLKKEQQSLFPSAPLLQSSESESRTTLGTPTHPSLMNRTEPRPNTRTASTSTAPRPTQASGLKKQPQRTTRTSAQTYLLLPPLPSMPFDWLSKPRNFLNVTPAAELATPKSCVHISMLYLPTAACKDRNTWEEAARRLTSRLFHKQRQLALQAEQRPKEIWQLWLSIPSPDQDLLNPSLNMVYCSALSPSEQTETINRASIECSRALRSSTSIGPHFPTSANKPS